MRLNAIVHAPEGGAPAAAETPKEEAERLSKLNDDEVKELARIDATVLTKYRMPDGRLGVACEAVGGRTRWYRLVERPSPAHGPRYVNALSLCQRQASRPKRARPAPLLPLSPQLKRARSLASVDNFHDIDAAHALAELVSA